MAKTIQEINEKIRNGKAVVVNAEEIIDIVADKGLTAAARRVMFIGREPNTTRRLLNELRKVLRWS